MTVVRVVLLALFPALVLSGGTFSRADHENNVPILRDSYRVIGGSNLNFTRELYNVVSRKEGNIFFSPLSIQVILALAAQGARGVTQQEMITGLSLPQEQETTRNGFRQLLKALKKNDGESVKIANKIYTDRRYAPKQEFVQIAMDSFQSDGEKVNFQQSYQQVRRQINQWVEDNTAHKIKDLLSEGSIGSDTVMVLVNAVYFKASWKTQFNPENTKQKTFYVSPGEQKTVNMMHVNVDNFNFEESDELNAKILEIPYVGSTMSLVIILPNEKFGLREVETKLARLELRTLFKQMHTPEIQIKLPKFRLEQSMDLEDTLKQMGMNTMFSNSANFSGLASGTIKVSKVVHKAFIDVNEEGAEAAAATAFHSILLSAIPDDPDPIDFNADHPFLFILRHSRTMSILFMGRYAGPN